MTAIFDTITDGGRIAVRPADYAEMFQAALADGGVVRSREQDVRVRIYGPLEARLQTVDLMVLGGLTEGVWPPETRADPWLSRPMRQALGLDLPERRIGLSAHDFAQALGAKEVVLTRAARVAGAPTVASRFVQRLAAVAGEARWDAAIERGNDYLAFARQLDRPQRRIQDRSIGPTPRPALWKHDRNRCRSPRSRRCYAIPIRSTRGTCSVCARSMRSTRRLALATAAL